MDIGKKLLEIVEDRSLVNFQLVCQLVKELDIKYKYQVLFMIKRSLPRLHATCDFYYNDNEMELINLLKEFVKDNGFERRLSYSSFEYADLKWINEYIIDPDILKFKQEPCKACNK